LLAAPEDHCNLSCGHALLAALAAEAGSRMTAAEGQAAAERAMDALRRAVAAGFGDLATLRTDTDLDALRPRTDFKQLLKELEAKAAARRIGKDNLPQAEKK
jgi:hypothetical protein